VPYPHLLVLNQYLRRVAAGEIQRLIVEMPPQHGKSELLSRYLPAWFLCRWPQKHVILTSYEAEMAAKWGRMARNVMSEMGNYFDVKISDDTQAANRWYTNQEGSMRAAGARGPITGNPADLLIIDDPVKGAQDAFSSVMRVANKEWYHSSCESRLSKNAAVICGMARWHRDDLAAYLAQYWTKAKLPFTVLRMPAIALKKEDWGTLFKRKAGQALCEEMHPLSQLQPMADLNNYWWRSLYQQDPPDTASEAIFRREWFTVVPAAPANVEPIDCIRAWDLAASISETAKYTCGVKMARGHDGCFYVIDVVRGRWIPSERDEVIHQTAMLDTAGVRIAIEQEPGSGGPAQCEYLTRRLAGFNVDPVKVSQDRRGKVGRANPFASQAGARNVKLVAGRWNQDYIDELIDFGEDCAFSDQVDASAMCFNALAGHGRGWNPSKKVTEYEEDVMDHFRPLDAKQKISML
jgi:predicted phage terminase large subunit-like protein